MSVFLFFICERGNKKIKSKSVTSDRTDVDVLLALLLCNYYQTVNDGVAHSKNPKECAYHVTFDLDLDLEHTLDAR